MIEDQRNREFGTDGLIMVVGFLLVRRNVPGRDDHDAVCPGFLRGFGEQDRVRGAVRAGAGIDLAAMVHVFDGVAVDLQLLLQRHGYKLARAAAGDDARRAVFDQKVDQLVKRDPFAFAPFLFAVMLLGGLVWHGVAVFGGRKR